MHGEEQTPAAQEQQTSTQVREGRRRLAYYLSTLFFCNSGIDHLLAGSSLVGNQFTFLHNRRQQASSRQTANREPLELSCDLIQHTSSGDNLQEEEFPYEAQKNRTLCLPAGGRSSHRGRNRQPVLHGSARRLRDPVVGEQPRLPERQ